MTLARGLLASLWLLLAPLSTAVAQSPAQLDYLRTLSPAQKQSILNQIEQAAQPETHVAPAPDAAQPTTAPRTDDEAGSASTGLTDVLRLRSGDTVLIRISAVSEDPGRSATEFVEKIRRGNPYQLDRMGRLVLHDGTTIALAGLSVDEAAARLEAEPRLAGFRFGVQQLPVEPELKLFGHELFSNVPTTFAPATDIPVPAEYVVGPGDTFEVQLIGERSGRYTIPVGRDGAVDFAELGPIQVAGLRYDNARQLLEQRVSEQMIGTRASVALGPLRSMQIFVVGEAVQPGSYTVSGLSTITNALFASGGVKPIGSLRNIQLKRGGRLIGKLDLYDLLLKGDTSGDLRLLAGDVILIPPVGATVAVSGEVQRPAIYEVREGTDAISAVQLAGGLTPTADPRTAMLERIDDRLNRIVLDLDLTTAEGRGRTVQGGDQIRIQGIRNQFEQVVSLQGHVHRGGNVQFRPGMRLTDLLGSLDELQPLADLHYVLIRRESGPDRRVSVLSADAAAAFTAPGSAANVELQSGDRVYVFDLATGRDRVVGPIIQDLSRQSGIGVPRQVAGIGGRVKVPGQYPLEPGMRVRDLLRAGGSLDETAYGAAGELTRYEVIGGERRQIAVVDVNLAGAMTGDPAANLPLQPYDYLMIRAIPDWSEQETITLTGEVRFPGTYPIRRGESLRSVIDRAGGLSELAFPEGSVFTRQDLKLREQHQMDVLAERLQRELAALSLQQARSDEAGGTAQAMTAGQQLLEDLRSTQAVGRLVIELDQIMRAAPGSRYDLIVKNGDQLVVPRRTQEVTVIGEVQNPTSHLYAAELTRDEYVERSGGLTQRADRRRIFTIRANGSVAAAPSSFWFRRSGALDIRPGDTVVVPLDAQQVQPLTLWTSVTQILYHIAVAVAAVNSF